MLDGPQNIAIEKSVEVPRQSALDAHFGRALLPGLARFAHHIFGRKRVGIRRAGPSPEAAEAAAHKTDIGKVDVAVYDVGDGFADGFAPQRIGDRNQGIERRAFGGRKQQALLER